ncbi:MAG: hypothetical protein M1549_03485 [Candidatus Dependentiae bacterium]|nr:hypothetical protein [Candidatus Dependentiae bacterium]
MSKTSPAKTRHILGVILLTIVACTAAALFTVRRHGAIRSCRVSVSHVKSYRRSFNYRLLGEVQRILTNPEYRLPESLLRAGLDADLERICQQAREGKLESSGEYEVLKNTDSYNNIGSMVVRSPDKLLIYKIFRTDPEHVLGSMGQSPTAIGMWLTNRINRYMLGFTRLSNRREILDWFERSPDAGAFRERFFIPRKWLWVPRDALWTPISWREKRKRRHHEIHVPDTYIIVCQACHKLRDLTESEKKEIFALIQQAPAYISIDPNASNFFVQHDGKIVIIDTEKTDYIFGSHLLPSSYLDWIMQVVTRSIDAMIEAS